MTDVASERARSLLRTRPRQIGGLCYHSGLNDDEGPSCHASGDRGVE